jgi:sodium/hydrogen exchanger 8
MAFSGILQVAGASDVFAPLTQLNVEFFLLFLLPPIIFESGYSLDMKPFFKNFGAILVYAFSGTFISAMMVGSLIFSFGGIFEDITSLSLAESFAFGALISATDPVSVLAIMKDLNTDARLFNLVFGESIFNDAVTIVLYRTIMQIKDEGSSMETFLRAGGFFIVIFIGSFIIGVLVAFGASWFLKKTSSYNPHTRTKMEASVVILGPWVSYLLSEALSLSGIVSILFSGMIMAKYTYPNLSESGKETVGHAYETVAHASETLIFVFVGMGLFSFNLPFEGMGWALFFWMIFSVLLARGANILINTSILNYFQDAKISPTFQFIMWFSGLRGAIAFALAIDSSKEFLGGGIILTMTLSFAIITIIFVAGAIAPILIKLDVLEKPGDTSPSLPQTEFDPDQESDKDEKSDDPEKSLEAKHIEVPKEKTDDCFKKMKRWMTRVD